MRTARLGFAVWGPDDFHLAFALWGDPRVTRLFGGPFSVDQVRTRLAREAETQALHGIQYWPLYRLEDDAHLGCGGLRPWREPGVLELGLHLRPEFWKHGYATEAARAVAAHAFNTLAVRGLFAGHHPENRDSRHLLDRLKFRGVGEELYEPTGLMHPSYMLDRTDWMEAGE